MAETSPHQPSGRGQQHPPPSLDKETDRLTTLAEQTRLRLGQQPQIGIDPSRRKDGRCAQCRGERPEVAVKNQDPFCSTTCARDWHDQSSG